MKTTTNEIPSAFLELAKDIQLTAAETGMSIGELLALTAKLAKDYAANITE